MNEAFSKLWRSFFADENIPFTIEKHKRERASLVSCLQRLVSSRQAARSEPTATRALEVGCGTAIDSYLLAAGFPSPAAEVVATDLSRDALHVAAKLADYFPVQLHLAAGDLLRLSFPDGAFDIVFSQGVMEHFADPLPGLREQARVLTRGGFLVVDVPQKYNLYTLYKRPRVKNRTWRYGWETQYSPAQLRAFGRQLGLTPLEAFGYGHGLELSGRFPLLARAVRTYNLLTHAASRWPPLSQWLLLNVVVVFRKP